MAVAVRSARGRRLAAATLPLLRLLSASLLVIGQGVGPLVHERLKQVWGPLLPGLTFTGLIAHVVSSPASVASRALTSRPLHFFQKYSYGLYVFHHLLFPVWLALLEYLYQITGVYRVAAIGMVLMAGGISIGLSMLSWACFERPLLDQKRRFEYSKPTTP